MNSIPELEKHCGSWTIIDRRSGKGVFETFNRQTAKKVNQEKYQVLTTLQYLGQLNAKIQMSKTRSP